MKTVENKRDLQIKNLIAELSSNNEDEVLRALKKIRSKGNADVLQPMIRLYDETSDEGIKAEISSILSELKISSALEPMMEVIAKTKSETQEMLLSSIWNSNLEANEYIHQIVDLARKGSYMTAVEAVTILDTLEPPFLEEVIQEAKLSLNDYFSGEGDEKSDLLKQILGIILRMEESIDA